MRQVAELHHHYDVEIGALVFEPEGVVPVKKAFEAHPLFGGWCRSCSLGNACTHWDTERLRDEGYGPVQLLSHEGQAAARMGLTWPWTQEQVQRAFRARALCTHPDHGGTNAQMHQLILDRDLLLERATRENRSH